jgi:hypothetical protein
MSKVDLNNFKVEILNSVNEKMDVMNIDGGNYVPLRHKTEYKIKLSNSRQTKCDATVYVDGEDIGTWRVTPFNTITLERTSDVKRKFTYVDEESKEAVLSGMQTGHRDNGLIRIVFKPEKQQMKVLQKKNYGMSSRARGGGFLSNGDSFGLENSNESMQYKSMNMTKSKGATSNNMSSGGTLLGGSSHQEFSSTSRIQNYDTNNITEISLRLVTNNDLDIEEEEFIPIARKKTSYPKRLEESDEITFDDTYLPRRPPSHPQTDHYSRYADYRLYPHDFRSRTDPYSFPLFNEKKATKNIMGDYYEHDN